MTNKNQPSLISDKIKENQISRKTERKYLSTVAIEKKQTLSKQIMNKLERQYGSIDLSFEIKK